MAFDTRSLRDRNPMSGSGVAAFASGIVRSDTGFEGCVRRMTGNAIQTARALPKATTGREQERLVPRIPRVLEISRGARSGRHAVAISAEAVHVIGRELSRFRHGDARRI